MTMPKSLLLRVCLTFLGGITATGAFAQDPTFTQFYANRLYINPAFAGADQGVRVGFNFRRLWTSVPGQYQTFAVSADLCEHNIAGGIGFIATNHTEGQGKLNTQKYGLSYSYRLIVRPRMFDIHFGVEGAYLQKQVGDWSQFVFSDQLDPVKGNVNPTSAPVNPSAKAMMADINAGILARFNFKPGNDKSRTLIANTLGFSAQHVNMPNESLTGGSQRMPLKFVVHYSMMVPVSKRGAKNPTYLSPNFMFENMGNLNTLNAGMYVMKMPVMLGVWYRNGNNFALGNSDAIMFNIGMRGTDKGQRIMYQIGYSYDLTISKLNGATNGTHEISAIFELSNVKLFGLNTEMARKRARNCYDWRGPRNMPKIF
jgi:type IX secretion system PorP/SprF family membrane protein